MTFLTRRRALGVSVGCIASALAVPLLSERSSCKVSRQSHALGTRIELTVLASNERSGSAAIAAALAEIDAVENALSLYRAGSDLCRLNRAGELQRPDARLVEVLTFAQQVSAATEGAFDVTVQPLWNLYRARQRAGGLPSAAELATMLPLVDWRRIELREDYIRLKGEGTQLTLNGIAQGYAADRASQVLQKYGVQHALVDCGELLAQGRQHRLPWKVGVQHPDEPDAYVALTPLADRALATSADYATVFDADGAAHHLLNPATGISAGHVRSVSIAAPTAMEADALSTACFVLGIEKSLALLASRPGCDALFVTPEHRMIRTAGFSLVDDEVNHG